MDVNNRAARSKMEALTLTTVFNLWCCSESIHTSTELGGAWLLVYSHLWNHTDSKPGVVDKDGWRLHTELGDSVMCMIMLLQLLSCADIDNIP